MSKKAREEPACFVRKLWEVLEEKRVPDAFKWDSDGKEVEINLQKCDDDKLEQELRIQISSLDRQMRLFGFKKNARDSQRGKLVYSNPYFQKGQKELLSFIRPKDGKKSQNRNDLAVNSSMNNGKLQEEEKNESRALSCEEKKIKRDQEAGDQQSSSNAHQRIFQLEAEKRNSRDENSQLKYSHEDILINIPVTEYVSLQSSIATIVAKFLHLQQELDERKQKLFLIDICDPITNNNNTLSKQPDIHQDEVTKRYSPQTLDLQENSQNPPEFQVQHSRNLKNESDTQSVQRQNYFYFEDNKSEKSKNVPTSNSNDPLDPFSESLQIDLLKIQNRNYPKPANNCDYNLEDDQ